MNVSDPIADMLTRIRNASRARHADVVVPARGQSGDRRILLEEGFIARSARSTRALARCCASRSSTSMARLRSCRG